MNKIPIDRSIQCLKSRLSTVARVSEWAILMDYENTKLFSRHFLRHFKKRPSSVLIEVRLQSIVRMLREDEKSCMEIAWMHSLPDEKALYNFVARHVGCAPTHIKTLSDRELQDLLENTGS